MKNNAIFVGTLLTTLAPVSAMACACGCGIFDEGVTGVTPQDAPSGLSAFVRFSTMVQNTNREQGHAASADDNSDKRIQTDFTTVGLNYTISPKWMVMAQVPLVQRHFTTTTADANGNPLVETVPLTSVGDALIRATYTGFSPDKTTGLGIGIKLPTGRFTSPIDRYGNEPYDRDTLPGTGSTDLEVSGFHTGHLAGAARWFITAQYKFAVATRDDYRPGNEINAGLGVTYALPVGKTTVLPTLQLIGSVRAHDTGSNADTLNSGYQRLLIAPGVRVKITPRLSVYGDVALPIAQYVNAARSVAIEGTAGQLTAPALVKLQIDYGF